MKSSILILICSLHLCHFGFAKAKLVKPQSQKPSEELHAQTRFGDRQTDFSLQIKRGNSLLSVETSSGEKYQRHLKNKDAAFILAEFTKLTSESSLPNECHRNKIIITHINSDNTRVSKLSCLIRPKVNTDPYIRFANILTQAVL